MAINPLTIPWATEIDENFYECTSSDCSVKTDFSPQFKINFQTFLLSHNSKQTFMGSDSANPNLSSWPGNMSYTDGPENDHTYNFNENRLKYELSDINSTCEYNMYTYPSFIDTQSIKTEDDVFQVDKADLIQGPTLAELNADSSLLDIDPLEFDDIILPGEENSSAISRSKLNNKSDCSSTYQSGDAVSSIYCTEIPKMFIKQEPASAVNDVKQKISTDWNLKAPFEVNNGVSKTCGNATVIMPSPTKDSVANANANKTDLFLDTEDEKLEIVVKQEDKSEQDSNNLENVNMWAEDSNDEGFDSDSDVSDHEDGYLLDQNLRSPEKFRNQEKYFWQYNLQAKGPKTHTVTLSDKLEDPHCLQGITDPVFNPECQVILKGIKHTGKARRGDGNDLNPSPTKLHSIGKELKKLNRIINDISSNDSNGFARSSCRKEKNKLASRVCRLKKKAQHEANKLKLYALQDEHKRFLNCVGLLKGLFYERMENPNSGIKISEEVNEICSSNTGKSQIAGRTTEFINDILENVSRGVPQGGLSMY